MSKYILSENMIAAGVKNEMTCGWCQVPCDDRKKRPHIPQYHTLYFMDLLEHSALVDLKIELLSRS